MYILLLIPVVKVVDTPRAEPDGLQQLHQFLCATGAKNWDICRAKSIEREKRGVRPPELWILFTPKSTHDVSSLLFSIRGLTRPIMSVKNVIPDKI